MIEFFGNIKQEFEKITWPTGKEMKLHSTQVFVFMIVLSLFFAGVDAIISTGVAAATGEEEPIIEEGDYDYDDLDELLNGDYDDDDYDNDYDDDDYDEENGDED